MGDTANWEFAAVVAAVCIGLGGLLLFTLVGAAGIWRMQDGATRAATRVAEAAEAMQELARTMIAAQAEQQAPMIDLKAEADEVNALRLQAEGLLEQQHRLQDAVRNLIEAGVLQGEESGRQMRELEQALKRIEEHVARMTAPGQAPEVRP